MNLMHRSTWKCFERYIAGIFSSTRNSLSGGNSKMTRSDSLHPHLFISCKYTQSNNLGLRKLVDEEREKAAAENKTAICVIGQAGDKSNAIVVLHLKDLPQLCQDIRDGKIQASLEPHK
jgi:hypothetical protein